MTTAKSQIDWEAIEREYRAGQFTVREIGRQYGASHTAINKRAKEKGWKRDLSKRVREEVSTRLVSSEVSNEKQAETEAEAINLAAARGVQVVREHREAIKRGQTLVSDLMDELREATSSREEIEAAIETETDKDRDSKRRNSMLRAVSLPSRSTVVGNLATALKTLVGLERQAFNLDEPDNSGEIEKRVSSEPLTEEQWESKYVEQTQH